MDLQSGKGSSREAGGLFIGLAKKASRWKKSPEKVIPSDEPMVPPCWASDHLVTNRSQYSRWTLKPRQYTDAYTDAPSDHPVLKAPHLGRYCMIWIKASDGPMVSSIQASVHPVLKQKSWRISVEFKCNRQMNRWSRRRIIWCLSSEPWPIL
jgi:hypothetical protein